MKISILIRIGLFLLFAIVCSCQSRTKTVEEKQNNKKLFVSFTLDDSLIVLNNNFTVSFINDRDTIQTKITKNELSVSNFKTNAVYKVIFKYKKYDLEFKGVSTQMIFPNQDVEWKFGIDNRPFNRLKGVLSDKEYNDDKEILQIQYLQFNMLEQGDGIQFVNKIPLKNTPK